MALIVEDGTGLANADSYASTTEADAYYTSRGLVAWATLTLGDKEAALRRATDYMHGEYGNRWRGLRSTLTQALDHPRRDVPIPDVYNAPNTVTYYDVDELIPAVKTACIALAVKAAAGELAPDIDRALIQDTVGPITQKWDKGSSQRVKYRAIDDMLISLLKPSSFSVTVGRA